MLKTSRSLRKERNNFVEFLITRVKLDRDIAEETASVLIEGQTKDGIIEENDLQAAVDSERQILRVVRPVKTSEVCRITLCCERFSARKGRGKDQIKWRSGRSHHFQTALRCERWRSGMHGLFCTMAAAPARASWYARSSVT